VDQLLRRHPEISNQEVKLRVREWCRGDAGVGLSRDEAREVHVHTRDMAITGKDVQNIRRKVEKASYQLADDPAMSVHLCQARNSKDVFVYRPQRVAQQAAVDGRGIGLQRVGQPLRRKGKKGEERVEQLQSFHLGLCTPWQKEMLTTYGRTSCLDSTFGSNDKAFPLFTVLVIDGHWHGIPVAWDLMSGQTTGDIVLMLRKLKEHCPAWRPEVFIVDDCNQEINAIKQVFPMAKIIICNFHVKKTFVKQIIAKVSEGI
jgi:hypothetical protein